MGRRLVVGVLVVAAIATGAFIRPGQASTHREDHMRAEIGQLLNGERANRSLGQLPIDANLSNSAQAWAEQMRASNCQPPENCHSGGNDAEILAWGVSNSRTGAIVVAWMQSTTHRNILLHPRANAMGVGFACSEDGTVFTAVQFGGVYKPVHPTDENPIASDAGQGSACIGPAAYLAQTAPPSTTPSPPPSDPPSTSPPPTQAPRRSEPAVVVRRTPPSTVATTVSVTASPETTTTTSPPVVLSAGSTRVTANLDGVEVASEAMALPPRHKAESAWLFMIVVVVFLSVIRVGFQLRDSAESRSKDSVRGAGL